MTFCAYIPIQAIYIYTTYYYIYTVYIYIYTNIYIYIHIYIYTVVHTLCIWGHKYSMYTNVPENLTFLCPRYKYKYLNTGVGEGGKG